MKKRQVTRDKGSFLGISNLIRVLLATFVILIQIAIPVFPVFANELDSTESTVAPEQVESEPEEPEQEVIGDDIEEEEFVAETEESTEPSEVVPIDANEVTEPEAETILASTTEEITSEEEDDTTVAYSSEENPLLLPESEEEVPEETSSTTVPEGEIDDATSTPEVIVSFEPEAEEEVLFDEEEEEIDEVGTTTATTTDEVTVVQPEVHLVTNDDNRYTFGVDDCARVADGSFYCTPEQATTTTIEDRVYAGPDADGDSEIFIDKDGETTQVTHNLVDDVAPFYDEISESIVWHRLVDARYQIVSLDIETFTERQLTFDSYNNMQPTRSGGLIVWQGWVGNDWEIMMSDDGEISMLTDNTIHDIGPRINGEFVIWQSEEIDGWKIRVFNTETGSLETIDDADGASIENPRLVLVYDAKHENGDVETRGYDLDTGKNVTLSSEAPKLPDELPDPDQTGEDRALINAATQLKPKTDEEEEGEPDIVPLLPEFDTGTSTESGEGDVVIPPFDDSSEDDSSSSSPEVPHEEPSDLVIPPLASTENEPPVEDLIIPPFNESTVDTTDDSQSDIAKTE